MTFNNKPNARFFSLTFALIAVSFAMSVSTFAFADSENDFTAITDDTLQNDPVLAEILANTEKSKQEFSDFQDAKIQERLIEEQRTMSKLILEQEIQQMFKDNEEYAPLNVFNKFLDTVPDDNSKTVFKGLFDYKQEKVDSARSAWDGVIKNGGSVQEALRAYHEEAKISRVDMVQLVTDLNIRAGFSDADVQKHFDENGKLPRYDDASATPVFVDLTTSSKNVNSSDNDANSDDNDGASESGSSSSTAESNGTETSLVEKLLDEIRLLKDTIRSLEASSSHVQQTVFEQSNRNSIHYADWMIDYREGKGHATGKIAGEKSVPANALNAPNSYADQNNSVALGRGGEITLGFSNLVGEQLIVYEVSSGKNLYEKAKVEVSVDGKNWVSLNQFQFNRDDSFVREYGFDLSEVGCVNQVRITDYTLHRGDGFDVDAIGATKTCTSTT